MTVLPPLIYVNMKYLILITRKLVAAVEENFVYPENMAIIIISGTETGQEFRDSLMNECKQICI